MAQTIKVSGCEDGECPFFHFKGRLAVPWCYVRDKAIDIGGDVIECPLTDGPITVELGG